MKISKVIGGIAYGCVGLVMSVSGHGVFSWPFWAVLGLLVVVDFASHISAQR